MSPFSFAYSQKLLFRILGDESICAQMIFPYLMPLGNPTLVYTNLKNKDLPESMPEQTFRLIRKIFSEEAQWPSENFRIVMDRIVSAKPKIKADRFYVTINDYLIRHNL